MNLSVATVDVGYGTTTLVCNGVNNGYMIRTFQSTPVPISNSVELAAGIGEKRDVETICIDGIWYEVGPDTQSSISSRTVRILNTEGFISSSRYKALMLGALAMTGRTHFDVLVLGLPVSVLFRKNELIEMATGSHDIGNGRSITVGRVFVFEQPLGALMSYIRSRSLKENRDAFFGMQNETILTIDPGFLTNDWLLSRGMKPDRQRSGDVEYGMSKVLASVEASLREQLAKNSSFSTTKGFNLELIDQAFLNGVIKLFGKEMSFPICESPQFDVTNAIRTVTDEAVQAIVNLVGDGQEIDRIIVSGGPAQVYLPSIKAAFPHHMVEVIPQSITAVARGLQTAGEQYLMAEARKVARG